MATLAGRFSELLPCICLHVSSVLQVYAQYMGARGCQSGWATRLIAAPHPLRRLRPALCCLWTLAARMLRLHSAVDIPPVTWAFRRCSLLLADWLEHPSDFLNSARLPTQQSQADAPLSCSACCWRNSCIFSSRASWLRFWSSPSSDASVLVSLAAPLVARNLIHQKQLPP